MIDDHDFVVGDAGAVSIQTGISNAPAIHSRLRDVRLKNSMRGCRDLANLFRLVRHAFSKPRQRHGLDAFGQSGCRLIGCLHAALPTRRLLREIAITKRNHIFRPGIAIGIYMDVVTNGCTRRESERRDYK